MFTDQYIKSLISKKYPYRVYDNAADKGFGIQVSTNSRVFFIQYQSPVTHKRRFMRLGKYPHTPLKLARHQCRVARQLLDKGLDPQVERKRQQQRQLDELEAARKREEMENATGTVNQLFACYLTHLKNSGKVSYRQIKASFEKDIKPAIGNLKAREVKPIQIRNIIRSVYNRGSKIQASHIRSYLMAAYTFGLKADYDAVQSLDIQFRIEYNPARDIPVPARSQPGERNLSAEEIYALWHRLETSNMSNASRTVIRLLFATGGQRVQEVLHMRWDELDFERKLWELSSTRTKNGKPHVVPLSDLAISLVKEMHSDDIESEYVFPYKNDKDIPMPFRTITRAVSRFCELIEDADGNIVHSGFPKFVPKDIRRTVKSRMGEAGITKDIRDRLQNHALHDVSSKHYDRYDYLQPKKDAIIKWTEWLEEILNDHTLEIKADALMIQKRSIA